MIIMHIHIHKQMPITRRIATIHKHAYIPCYICFQEDRHTRLAGADEKEQRISPWKHVIMGCSNQVMPPWTFTCVFVGEFVCLE